MRPCTHTETEEYSNDEGAPTAKREQGNQSTTDRAEEDILQEEDDCFSCLELNFGEIDEAEYE